MTTTLTLTSGQTSFTAAGYTILPAGTPVPDGAVGAIMQAAISAGVFISGAAGTGTTFIGSRRFVSSSTGAPVSGSWLVGDEVVDTAGAVWEYTAAGTWAAVGATGSGTSVPTQTGNAGKVLTTDGTTLAWSTPSSSTSVTTDPEDGSLVIAGA